jgi:hypothetical protein
MKHSDNSQQPASSSIGRRGFLVGIGGAAASVAAIPGLDAVSADSKSTADHIAAAPAPTLQLGEIQGNILAGFHSDHQAFVFIGFPSPTAGRAWLSQLTPRITSVTNLVPNSAATATPWINVAVSFQGLIA